MTQRRKPLLTVLRLPATLSLMVVHAYRHTLSPDHGPLRHFFPYGYCRHDPTCSSYALEVLKTESYPKAVWKVFLRVLSCNPWRKPSDDRLKAIIKRSS